MILPDNNEEPSTMSPTRVLINRGDAVWNMNKTDSDHRSSLVMYIQDKWSNSLISVHLTIYIPYHQKIKRIQNKTLHTRRPVKKLHRPLTTLWWHRVKNQQGCLKNNLKKHRWHLRARVRGTGTRWKGVLWWELTFETGWSRQLPRPPNRAASTGKIWKRLVHKTNYFLKQMPTWGLVTRQLLPHIVSKTRAPSGNEMILEGEEKKEANCSFALSF